MSSCDSPITPFIGVRISWLIVARNSDLARDACSAASRAASSSSCARCWSISSRAVRITAKVSSSSDPMIRGQTSTSRSSSTS